MTRARLALLALMAATPAAAQIRPFSCVGAEQVQDDVFSVPFDRGSARVTEAARSALAAAEEALRADPDRVACLLGHAGQEGGASTSIRLAAERARAVAAALSSRGIERDRLRAEARSAQFSPRVRAAVPPSRTVTIVVLPAP
ncbi:OmpA family protein [Roseomonas sp. HF4]|uniref:OmpA family protein n=1 Tax=Roseomonas sp. HF4 TaxID=2562313 RepID=UPI00197F01F5|nr:OmpA family protein [Roseomonas sp. HF4]